MDFNFNTEEVVDVPTDFENLPAGTYTFTVDKLELKPTNDGTGAYVKASFVVAEGDFKNRIIWKNFNVKNKSTKAENIGRAQFKDLCYACEVKGSISDPAILQGKIVLGDVVIKESTNPQYPKAQNEIKKFHSVVGDIPFEAPKTTAPAWMKA